jgi:hypothetical protein
VLGLDLAGRRVVFIPSPDGRKKDRIELRAPADDAAVAGLALPDGYLMRAFLSPSVVVAFRAGLYKVDRLTAVTWGSIELDEPQLADARVYP